MILNKKEQTYIILKDGILHEKYEMGSQLNIKHISEELGISNSPVREALNMLEKEGLVISQANNVPRVVELSNSDMFEVAQIVFFLVLGAFRFNVHRKNIDILGEKMQKELEKEKKYLAEGELHKYTESNINFYKIIITETGNKRLLDEFEHLRSLFYLCTLAAHKSNIKKDAAIKNHEAFIESIYDRNYDYSVKLLGEYYYQDAWGGEVGR